MFRIRGVLMVGLAPIVGSFIKYSLKYLDGVLYHFFQIKARCLCTVDDHIAIKDYGHVHMLVAYLNS